MAASEMIKRAARAIEEAGYNPVTAEHIAEIVIKAMREPTEEMYEAAYRDRDPDAPDLIAVWRAMIDEALR